MAWFNCVSRRKFNFGCPSRLPSYPNAMQVSVLFISVAAIVFAGAGVFAQPMPATIAATTPHPTSSTGFEGHLKSLDRDGDGALSREEAEAGKLHQVLLHFGRIDTNGDGKVTPDELRVLIRTRLVT